MVIISHESIGNCELIVDAIYEGGNAGDVTDDPLSKILSVGNQAGFRYSGRSKNIKYIVLYSSGEDADWPDSIDIETGIFKYFGDNKNPGNDLHATSRKGNLILKDIFESLYNEKNPRQNIPPIFIFRKFPTQHSNRSVQFKGLCVPGAKHLSSTEDLVAVWKSKEGQRFQNYMAYFTILNIATISREWINDLNNGRVLTENTPNRYAHWLKKGKYYPLTSTRSIEIRSIEEQLPKVQFEKDMLEEIVNFFKDKPRDFEYLAAEIYKMTDKNLIIDQVTQKSRDGGYDAYGRLKLGLDIDPIYVDFMLEAKCYAYDKSGTKHNTVGVKETSRLISRIRNRQFGVLVTTSAVSKQAYTELRNDKHPILIISGGDIIKILIDKGINNKKVLKEYLLKNFFDRNLDY